MSNRCVTSAWSRGNIIDWELPIRSAGGLFSYNLEVGLPISFMGGSISG